MGRLKRSAKKSVTSCFKLVGGGLKKCQSKESCVYSDVCKDMIVKENMKPNTNLEEFIHGHIK